MMIKKKNRGLGKVFLGSRLALHGTGLHKRSWRGMPAEGAPPTPSVSPGSPADKTDHLPEEVVLDPPRT